MNKEFILYEQALALKELGFDEPCVYQYVRDFDNDGELIPIVSETNKPILRDNTQVSICSGGDCFASPLYQQAFRWFREKYNLIGLVEGGYDNGKNIFTYVIWDDFKDNIVDDYFHTYEEAELACLIKLIEIVKKK
jgi:hypothetical protein